MKISNTNLHNDCNNKINVTIQYLENVINK
jgi:hypothetical protein